MSKHITIQKLHFRYESQSDELFHNLNLHFGHGWSGIVGKNGSGKSTLAKIIAGQIIPDLGTIVGNQNAYYVSQNIDLSKEEILQFTYDHSKIAGRYRNLLKVKILSPDDFESLSFGEKRRLILALALSQESDVLILDEPTNHLDSETIQMIQDALKQYQGIGILISHDRHLLDELTSSCVFLEKNLISQRPGNFSEGKKEMEREAKERISDWQLARKETIKLDEELKRRREEASLSHKLRSKKGLDFHDHDGRHRKNLARVSGKDGMAGRLKNQIQKRTELAARKEKEIFSNLPEKEKLGIVWNTNLSKRKNIYLFEGKCLDFGFIQFDLDFHLQIFPMSKIAISGRNGSGKSTLLHFLVQELEKKQISHLYLPQEFSMESLAELLAEFHSLESEKTADVLSGIHRLGTDPKRFRDSMNLSPGEIKKLFLSLNLTKKPEILLLDEPTNHLDIKSVEALESSLVGLRTALVLVSHDQKFLQSVAEEEWLLENGGLTQKHLDKSSV